MLARFVNTIKFLLIQLVDFLQSRPFHCRAPSLCTSFEFNEIWTDVCAGNKTFISATTKEMTEQQK